MRRLLPLVVAVALVAGACGHAQRPELSTRTVHHRTTTTVGPTTTTADPNISTVATTPSSTMDVFAHPGDPAPARQVTAPEGPNVPLTFLVKKQKGDWLHVYLPARPNGSTGWIKKSGVTLHTHNFHIVVTLAQFNIKVYQGDNVILDAPVGVAKDNTPSPGGHYFTTALLQPPDPNGPYGPYAYGLSAFSDVFESFSGGPGQLGIHGTDDDSTIGTQVSHGCIRMHNSDIEKLVPILPVGVPVQIIN